MSSRSKPTRAPRKRAAGSAPAAAVAVALAADCTLHQVGALHDQLSKALKKPGPVTLDASAVRRIDAAGLQLLAAFFRQRHSQSRACSWSGMQPVLEHTAWRLGLAGALAIAPPGVSRS